MSTDTETPTWLVSRDGKARIYLTTQDDRLITLLDEAPLHPDTLTTFTEVQRATIGARLRAWADIFDPRPPAAPVNYHLTPPALPDPVPPFGLQVWS